MRHSSFGLSTSILTLQQRAQPFASGRHSFFRALHIGKLIPLYTASSLFTTQQQLTHPPVKSSTLPLKRMPIFWMLHLDIQFSLHPASSVFGTQQQPTHLLVKSSTFPLRKMSFFQGVVSWHKNFTLFCVIPLCESAKAHLPSGKELTLSSLEESCFFKAYCFVMFSHYPGRTLFGLVLIHITH